MAWGQINPANMRGALGGISNVNPSRNNSRGNNPDTEPQQTAAADSTADEVEGIEYHVDIPDSVLQGQVFMFHRPSGSVKIMSITHPTLTPTGAQFHDCLDRLNGDYYLTVGDLGHQHYSVFPTFSATPGLIYKSTLFPGFYKTPENIHFYQVMTPYAVLSYNSSLNNDYQVHFTHTQNINNHWNYALDYHLYSPKGSFSNSSASNHSLDLTTNYYSSDARYQLSAGFIWQRMTLGENGGLSNLDAYFNRPNANSAGLPVLYTQRMSTTRDITLFVKQSFNTVRQFEWYRPIHQTFIDTTVTYDTIPPDTLAVPDSASVVADSSAARPDAVAQPLAPRDSVVARYEYHVIDSIVGYDTLQPHAPATFNTGVFALELQWDKQKYRCTDSTLYNQLSATLFWTNDAYMDHRWLNPVKLYGGIRPQLSWLELNPLVYATPTVSRVALYPFGRLEISPFPAAELNVLAEVSPNLSEYNLDAQLRFPFRDTLGQSSRDLQLRAVVKAYSPELIYFVECDRLAHPVSSALQSVGVRRLEAQYTRSHLFDIRLAASHISHNIWFEEASAPGVPSCFVPRQTDSSALLLQATVNCYLQFGSWFHLDMQQMGQYSSDQNQIRVPLFTSKNSIYADFKLFSNALRAQVGFDVRYLTAYYADAYDAALGIFYRQDEVLIGNYIWADAFVNLQIKRASIYAKAGHLNSYFESRHYLSIPNYPSKQFGLYFGLTWKFFD